MAPKIGRMSVPGRFRTAQPLHDPAADHPAAETDRRPLQEQSGGWQQAGTVPKGIPNRRHPEAAR